MIRKSGQRFSGLVKSDKVDAFAANKANLFAIADKLPGSRVLEGRFSVDSFPLGLPKGRQAGLAYARIFIDDAMVEGLVKSAAEKAGVRGAIEGVTLGSRPNV
jgi:polar amino acid transport system substrate-binding protein